MIFFDSLYSDIFFLIDQSIPPGLHVQMNLQTGVRNAKLIENNKNSITNDLAITHSNKSEDIVSTYKLDFTINLSDSQTFFIIFHLVFTE